MNSYTLLVRILISTTIMKTSIEVLQTPNNRRYNPDVPLLNVKGRNWDLKEILTLHIDWGTIHNIQNMKPHWVSTTDEQMEKTWSMHNEVYLDNETTPFAGKELEPGLV